MTADAVSTAVRCQHCLHDIFLHARVPGGRDIYADRSGFVVCIKHLGPLPAGVEEDYVYHAPLPVVV